MSEAAGPVRRAVPEMAGKEGPEAGGSAPGRRETRHPLKQVQREEKAAGEIILPQKRQTVSEAISGSPAACLLYFSVRLYTIKSRAGREKNIFSGFSCV